VTTAGVQQFGLSGIEHWWVQLTWTATGANVVGVTLKWSHPWPPYDFGVIPDYWGLNRPPGTGLNQPPSGTFTQGFEVPINIVHAGDTGFRYRVEALDGSGAVVAVDQRSWYR
jgi:hypothetical protein